jgi:hypothetical protein
MVTLKSIPRKTEVWGCSSVQEREGGRNKRKEREGGKEGRREGEKEEGRKEAQRSGGMVSSTCDETFGEAWREEGTPLCTTLYLVRFALCPLPLSKTTKATIA